VPCCTAGARNVHIVQLQVKGYFCVPCCTAGARNVHIVQLSVVPQRFFFFFFLL
jgi:hypothetical protein